MSVTSSAGGISPRDRRGVGDGHAEGADAWRFAPAPGVVGDVARIGVLAAVALLVTSVGVDLGRFHYGAPEPHLNDQVSYVLSARTLADTGALGSNVIYPSVLHQNAPKEYFYMPGHYYALAGSYLLFGYGVLQSLAPCLLAFVLAAVLVFLSARRAYGRGAAFTAAALFVGLPPNAMYAFTAMAELPLVCGAALAVCTTVYLRRHSRAYAGGVLLAIPFVFRETAIFLSLAIASIVATGAEKRDVRRGAIALALGIVTCIALWWTIGSGRPSLLLPNIFDASFAALYLDSVAQQAISPRAVDWVVAPLSNVWRNMWDWALAAARLRFDAWMGLAIPAAGLLVLLKRRRDADGLAIAAAIVPLVVVLAMLVVYSPLGYRGLRMVLFTWPLVAIAASPSVVRALERAAGGRRVWPRVAGACVVAVGLWIANVMLRKYTLYDRVERDNARAVETISHDDRKVLITPGLGPLEYMLDHYPVKWSFLPANLETFRLVVGRYDVGTIVIPASQHRSVFGPGAFERYGLVVEGVMRTPGDDLLIFKCGRERCSERP